jgi:hypothetical protein
MASLEVILQLIDEDMNGTIPLIREGSLKQGRFSDHLCESVGRRLRHRRLTCKLCSFAASSTYD